MKLPEVRDAFTQLAADLAAGKVTPQDAAAQITALVPEMRRRPPVHRSPPRRAGLASARNAIIAYHAAHPGADYHEIATATGTQIGRVSETLAGKRT
ncbi:hypothetical protein ACJ41P_10240 [Azospirillum argentinense]|uniref:Uncharacterized protein n=1 Tax=Azospirillum argentinense TaxID=2970906 RepID=A0ABW8V5B0_9PROT